MGLCSMIWNETDFLLFRFNYGSTAKMSSNNLLWGIFTVNIEVFNSGNKSACI